MWLRSLLATSWTICALPTRFCKFEQRYWISSDVFYELYSQGQLDNGGNLEDFSEWAGFYKIKLKREAVLEKFSRQRVEQLQRQAAGDTIELAPQEPVLELA